MKLIDANGGEGWGDLLFLGFCLFCWWAQRDAYRAGREQGRLDERGDRLRQDLVRRGEHLRVVR